MEETYQKFEVTYIDGKPYIILSKEIWKVQETDDLITLVEKEN